MASRKIWDNLKPGNEYAAKRGVSMSKTAPPIGHMWCTHDTDVADYNGDLQYLDNELTDEGFRDRRLIWLEQFDLSVTTEGRWRYWRWLAEVVAPDDVCNKCVTPEGEWRRIVWWERRKTTDPYPTEPGLWPRDE